MVVCNELLFRKEKPKNVTKSLKMKNHYQEKSLKRYKKRYWNLSHVLSHSLTEN